MNSILFSTLKGAPIAVLMLSSPARAERECVFVVAAQDIETFESAEGQMLLSELCPLIDAQHGIVYVVEAGPTGRPLLKQLAGYADPEESPEPRRYRLGEGLVGQCASDRVRILLSDIPDATIHVRSGLVRARPRIGRRWRPHDQGPL